MSVKEMRAMQPVRIFAVKVHIHSMFFTNFKCDLQFIIKEKFEKKKQTLQSWHMQNLFGLNKRLVRLITHVLSLPKNV